MRKKILAAVAAAGFAASLAAGILTAAFMDRTPEDDDLADFESLTAAEQTEDGGAVSETDRQIVLSMGETSGSVSISWKGDERGTEYLRISSHKERLGAADPVKADFEEALGGAYYRYTVKLSGLEAGKKYYYQIGSGDSFENPRSFIAPEEKVSTEFLYLGDVQFNVSVEEYEDWERMTEDIYERHPEIQFAVLGGDMVNVPKEEEQWNGFLRNCGVFAQAPLMTVSGNHEGVSSNNTYKKMFSVPDNGPHLEELEEDFYYFDFGDCRFIMTDSSFLTEQRREKIGNSRWTICEEAIEDWLRRTIEESPKAWNIVVTHHPPYGMHDKDTVSPQLRRLWVPVWEEAGADLVLCGHQHMYMRTEEINGVTYVMGNSGNRQSVFFNGSNAPIYCTATYADGANYQVIKADGSKLRLTSYNKKGLIVDEAVIRKSLWFHILEFFGCNQIVVESSQMNEVV